MKTLISILLFVMAAAPVKAVEVTEQMANESALATDTNYDYYVNSMVGRRIGAVVTYGSATINAGSFVDGRQASGTITIAATTTLFGAPITIHGYQFIGGVAYVTGTYAGNYTSFFKVTSTVSGCATNLAYAINNHPILKDLLTATANSADVALVSDYADGVSYSMTVVTGATLSGATMTGAVTATVSGVTDYIYINTHSFTTGLPVLFATGTGGLTGLTDQTTYYAIRVNADYIQLATSKVNALAGTAIDITPTIGDTSHTFTLTPLAISGTPAFSWKASNDGTYWVTVPTVSAYSPTMVKTIDSYTAGGASMIWDFGWYAWRWLRLAVTAPTQGGILFKADVNTKE